MENKVYNEIHQIFILQENNYRRIALTSSQQRIDKLQKLRKIILDKREQIQRALYLDFKKAPAEVDLTEIFTAVSEINHTIKHLKFWMKPKRVSNTIATLGAKNKVIYQSKGVCLIISPWNYPFQLSIGPLISAVAAGNCVMLKPSEHTPHTADLIKDLLAEVFEEDEVCVCQGDKEVAQKLLDLPFNHIYFTGSPEVGKIIMGDAAKNLTSVTLELGGKSPVIVDENTDIKMAAYRITWGKLINAGQTCIAPDYVLVQENSSKEFIEEVKRAVNKLYGPLQEIKSNPDYCRIINLHHFNRIQNLMKEAIKQGGELVFGGDVEQEDLYISPTIIVNPSLNSSMMQQEIFAPLLPIITYKQMDEVFDIIQARPWPLVLYIFSSRKKFIQRVLSQTHSGDVLINDVVSHYANVKLPFGGVNTSGLGKAHGVYGFKEFSHLRSVMKQGRRTPANLFYPPYSQRVKKMIDLILKYF